MAKGKSDRGSIRAYVAPKHASETEQVDIDNRPLEEKMRSVAKNLEPQRRAVAVGEASHVTKASHNYNEVMRRIIV